MTDEMFANIGGPGPSAEQEPEFKTTLTPEQADAAHSEIRKRSFSGRNPQLGKMINCPFCGRRHRSNGDVTLRKKGAVELLQKQKCAQVFQVFREKPDGTLEPDYRTAHRPDDRPTVKQLIGAAAFAKKRFKPHSKPKPPKKKKETTDGATETKSGGN